MRSFILTIINLTHTGLIKFHPLNYDSYHSISMLNISLIALGK